VYQLTKPVSRLGLERAQPLELLSRTIPSAGHLLLDPTPQVGDLGLSLPPLLLQLTLTFGRRCTGLLNELPCLGRRSSPDLGGLLPRQNHDLLKARAETVLTRQLSRRLRTTVLLRSHGNHGIPLLRRGLPRLRWPRATGGRLQRGDGTGDPRQTLIHLNSVVAP
jgi:hypothetical protein